MLGVEARGVVGVVGQLGGQHERMGGTKGPIDVAIRSQTNRHAPGKGVPVVHDSPLVIACSCELIQWRRVRGVAALR